MVAQALGIYGTLTGKQGRKVQKINRILEEDTVEVTPPPGKENKINVESINPVIPERFSLQKKEN